MEKLESVTKNLSKKLKADFGGLSKPKVNNLKETNDENSLLNFDQF